MKSSSAMLPIFEIGTRLPYGPDTRGVLQRCFYAWNSSYLPHFFVDPLYMHKPKPPEPMSPCFSMLSLFKGLHVGRVLDFTLQGCLNKRLSGCAKDVHACRNFSRMFQKTCTLAQTLFGRRNVPAGLQELCSDVSKGMQSWKNFVPTAKCFLTSRSRSGSAPQVSCTCPDQCLPGQFIRLVVHAVGKLHHRERFLRALRALLRSHAAVNQRQLDIVQSGGAG